MSNKNYASVIDCDLQEAPELIAQNFSKIQDKQTIHFVRKKREDPIFQRFYTNLAYKFLHFISGRKIIINTNHFKIIPPHVVKKIKKNTEIHPYWNYLFTKLSTRNKIAYYVKKKRIHGSSKFNIFTLNPWIAFFSAVHYFRKRFVNIISSLLLMNILVLILVFYKFYNLILIMFLILFGSSLIVNLAICNYLMYYKRKNKRIFCKYK